MNKKKLIPVTFCLALSLSMPIRASAGGAQPEDLANADWSVNAAHNLASNPPSRDAVEDFTRRALGHDKGDPAAVCEFRFANLRNSGNLSLITRMNPGGRQVECSELAIVDRTPTGFEVHDPTGAGIEAHDLADSVLDLNHNSRHELVLWAYLAPYAAGTAFGQLGCNAEWHIIFAWTGNGYADVSDQYKGYYQKYLKSLNVRLATYSSLLAPAAAATANPAPEFGGGAGQRHPELSSDHTREASVGANAQAFVPSPEATPDWAAVNQAHRDYPCARIEAAKTEAFLGVDSASTMSAAIKDSESNDPNTRIAAAVIFSYLRTQEAAQDLKTLSNDADSRVAAAAKTAASFGEDPLPIDRTISRVEDNYVHLNEGQQSKH